MSHTTTTAPLHHVDAGVVALRDEQPQYRHVGGGTFKPANTAAWREVAAFNAWADTWNARTVGEVLQ